MSDWANSDELYELFRDEAAERLASLSRGLLALETSVTPDGLETIRRDAHSIKGSARLLGYPVISDIAHAMEDLLATLREGREAVTPEIVDVLLSGTDTLGALVEAAAQEHTTATEDLVAALRTCIPTSGAGPIGTTIVTSGVSDGPAAGASGAAVGDPGPSGPAPADSEPPTVLEVAPAGNDAGDAVWVQPAGATSARDRSEHVVEAETSPATREPFTADAPAVIQDVVRIEVADVHGLINAVGELLTSHVGIGDNVRDLSGVVRALDSRVRRLPRDASQLTARQAGDAFTALVSARDELSALVSVIRDRTDLAGKQIDLVHDQAMGLAMFPAHTVFGALPRLVRDLSRELGKTVELMVDDGDARLDKRVLDRVAEPIRALIINAVDHGIEDRETRLRIGKPETGRISLRALQKGNQVVIEVEDDGCGIDFAHVRAKATELGLIAEGSDIGPADVAQVLFRSGFTTAERVSDVSGRGVGLDVVREAIDYLKGSVEVVSTRGAGTRFVLTLPITLSMLEAVVAVAQGEELIVPVPVVDEVITVAPDDVTTLGGEVALDLRDQAMPLVSLAKVLGLTTDDGDPVGKPAIVLAQAGRHAAVFVDELRGQREVVVKGLGTFLPQLRHVGGTSVAGDGRVVLVLDPGALLETIRHGALPRGAGHEAARADTDAVETLRILVVDDSFPIREMERAILDDAGYLVTTASDGEEALELARIKTFDAVVTDIDMPRMNGFDLCAALRGELPTLPVIVVTSLSSEADRRRGLDAGASAYLTKSEFDQGVLLSTLRSLVGG